MITFQQFASEILEKYCGEVKLNLRDLELRGRGRIAFRRSILLSFEKIGLKAFLAGKSCTW